MAGRTVLFTVACLLYVHSASFADMLFDNGIDNLIDYDSGSVRVESFEGQPTGITIANKGNVGFAGIMQHCYASVLGGAIDFISAGDYASVTIAGGQTGYVTTNGLQSKVSIGGGTVGTVSINSVFSGGMGVSSIDIAGGTLGRVIVGENGIGNISGGIISQIETMGETSITGGDISSILNGQGGNVFLYGSDFLIDGLAVGSLIIGDDSFWDINDNPLFKKLTGTLANGDLLEADIFLHRNSQLYLIPEPASALLVAFGGLLLRKKRA